MADVYFLLEEHDQPIAEAAAGVLQQSGHAVTSRIVSRFFIADPLSSFFATVRQQYDAIVVLVSQSSRQTTWVLLELQTQRLMGLLGHEVILPFAVLLGNIQAPEPLLETRDSFLALENSDGVGKAILARLP